MYIPEYFTLKDLEQILRFMQRYSFATLITAKTEVPIATHLPFVIEKKEDAFILTSHMAKANEQAVQLDSVRNLVVFSEPHAYISPGNYSHVQNVPTWNYIAVHCYGKAQILHKEAETITALEKMISFYEPQYLAQWRGLPTKYKSGMIQEITAFEIKVDEVQAAAKMSQNKTAKERESIITTLSKSRDEQARILSDLMLKAEERNKKK